MSTDCNGVGACTHRAEVRFETRLSTITPENVITIVPEHGTSERIPVRLVIGADGAYSSARAALLRLSRIDYSQEYIEHGYKELTIPPAADGTWLLKVRRCSAVRCRCLRRVCFCELCVHHSLSRAC